MIWCPPIFAVILSLAFLQGVSTAEPTINVLSILPGNAPVIDGILDDAAWIKSTPISGFRQREPEEGAPGSQKTEVRLCFDPRQLYIAFRCFDTEPEKIRRTVLQRDTGMVPDDHVIVILDPYAREKEGFAFLANANGAKLDGKLSEHLHDPDSSWDTLWDAEATVDEEGWTVEMAIPFRDLNFDPGETSWAVNFGRYLPRNQEELRWTAVSRNRGIYRLQEFGRIEGLEEMGRGFGLDLQPYLSARWKDALGGLDFDTGMDAFYQATPNMTATLTFNTDFAETEIDQRQINLTRFPLFFPEKRDFFVEGAEFFEFGQAKGSMYRPFHSRTVGLSSTLEKVGILGGGKLTGRANRLGVGLFGAQLDDFGDVEGQDVYVGRFTYEVLKESRVGLISTYGDPRTGADNSLIGVDATLKNSRFWGDNVLTGKFWAVGTEDNGTGGEAFGKQVRAINDPLAFLFEAEQVDDEFRPGMGFLSRTGQRGRAFLRYRFRPDSIGSSISPYRSMKTSMRRTMGTWKPRFSNRAP